MTERKRLVLDANILLRAVLGIRVSTLILQYQESIAFYSPDICLVDARTYVGVLADSRKLDATP